jgi:hypothetical protein
MFALASLSNGMLAIRDAVALCVLAAALFALTGILYRNLSQCLLPFMILRVAPIAGGFYGYLPQGGNLSESVV